MPASLRTPRVLVIGAGIGGLTAALTLACDGWDVVVVERAGAAGGKLRTVESGGVRIDCGPTVLTMRGIFDAIFAQAGEHLDAHLRLTPAEILARHAWQDDSGSLDLYADVHRTADAIASFAGASEARGYLGFCAAARALFESLDAPFIRANRPDMLRLAAPAARGGLAVASAPFRTLWNALGRHFDDPRLRQLFGRYATYCGSSPFESPATLMLVAHAEQAGVWLVEGGMHRLAEVMAALAAARGVTFRFGAEVSAIRLERGHARSVELADGERIEADAVVSNADCAALASGLFGDDVRGAASAPTRAGRSLSAITFALRGTAEGFPLARHNVFFSRDYRAEFDDIAARRVPRNPTVYICAQDRDDGGRSAAGSEPERLFCIVNAPATGDTHTFDPSEIALCEAATFQALKRSGLALASPDPIVTTTPDMFHGRYPATGGALYGAASHGWMASLRRSGVRSRIPGLYLCGGSIHPGPGLPMAALSGQMAAQALTADLASMRRVRPAAARCGDRRSADQDGALPASAAHEPQRVDAPP